MISANLFEIFVCIRYPPVTAFPLPRINDTSRPRHRIFQQIDERLVLFLLSRLLTSFFVLNPNPFSFLIPLSVVGGVDVDVDQLK